MMKRMVHSVVGKPKIAHDVPSSTSTHMQTAVAVGSLQFRAVCHLRFGTCNVTF